MAVRCNARRIAGVFCLLLLGACATPPQTRFLIAQPVLGLPQHAELEQVEFFPQQVHQCGPAALAMALSSSGVDIRPEQLSATLYLPVEQGSLQVEMLAAARSHGRVAYLLQPQLSALLSEVAAGNPVLILQNLGLSWYPVWHYAVVVGYNLPQREVILRSGNERRQMLPFAIFERTWARSHYWAMLVLPPGRLPRTAEPDSYVLALLALAHSNPRIDVWPGYAAALERWSTHLPVQIGAGNYAYAHNELGQAERIYFKATQDHPDSAVAFNNLAQVQGEVGKLHAALESARRAVEIGGSQDQAVRETLSEIKHKLQCVNRGKDC